MRKLVGMGLTAGALLAAAVVPWSGAEASGRHGGGGHHGSRASHKLLFFASDGMRQDAVQRYVRQGADVPEFRALLRNGVRAGGNGLLTQAPPNTGAGWYTLATGAWPGVHGSINNTFHINGSPFAGSTSFSSPKVLQAETVAQAAERAGKKVAQIEWVGGRSGAIDGPTLDFRNFRSGRGVVTNYTSPSDNPAFAAQLGVQYDKADPVDATGWTNVPESFSPAKEMHMRVLDGKPPVDKYGLNAYIYDSRDDSRTDYDRVLFSRTKIGDDAVGDLRQGEIADVKVKIQDSSSLNGKTGAMLVKVERLAGDLSQVRLFHTSVTRAIATWTNWPGEPGFTGSFEDFVAERFPSSQAGDFAVLESGVVSEETYIQQQQYWETLYHPLIEYVLGKYKPDLAMVGFPGTDEVQHQFLGLVTRKLPNGADNPSYDDVNLDGVRDRRVKQREEYVENSYAESDATMRLAQKYMDDRDLNTLVAADHGFAPQFLAIDASKVLVDLGLLQQPQPGNCRTSTTDTIRLAKACYAGGALQIYLNVEGRDPAPPTVTPPAQPAYKQLATTDVDA